MKNISDFCADDVRVLTERTPRPESFGTAEETAQEFSDIVYDYFRKSVLLARVFATIPFVGLPAQDRDFVRARAAALGNPAPIEDGTPVLTLLGTRGLKSEWNDRSLSRKFRCIPLFSTEFVTSLPMLLKVFEGMKFDVDLIDRWNAEVVSKGSLEEYTGTLHVRDAATDIDELGRKIIPAQDFVADYGVKSVLGIGSGYGSSPTFMTLFLFTNEAIDQAVTRHLQPLADAFMSASVDQIRQSRVFTD